MSCLCAVFVVLLRASSLGGEQPIDSNAAGMEQLGLSLMRSLKNANDMHVTSIQMDILKVSSGKCHWPLHGPLVSRGPWQPPTLALWYVHPRADSTWYEDPVDSCYCPLEGM